MQYNYLTGARAENNKLKTLVVAGVVALVTAVAATMIPALAATPANPGCFGTDRAAWLNANGGQAWGQIAPTRAGDNGTINQAYKTLCGGDPA